MHDRHYTPSEVAARMADAAMAGGLPSSGRALDFAAGEGVLLEAVAKQVNWQMIACDLDPTAVASLKRRYPTWIVGRCDIYSAASRASSSAMKAARGADLVVLNPPYSYRGNRSRSIRVANHLMSGSPASCAFVLAAQQVCRGGVVVGLLPLNARHSEKDQRIWSLLASTGRIEPVEVLHRGTFSGEFATTEIVRWTKKPPVVKRRGKSVPPRPILPGCRCVDLIRGTVPVHQLGRPDRFGDVTFLHSTSLRAGSIRTDHRKAAGALETPGPFLLLPRVGLVSRDKMAVRKSAAVLSDCLFALRPRDPEQLLALLASMSERLVDLSGLYTGTCARYLTVARLTSFLTAIGWHVTPVAVRARPVRTCDCGAAG